MKKREKCDIFSGCQSIFLFFGLNDLFICILKGFGSFLLVANKSGQKWFRGSVFSFQLCLYPGRCTGVPVPAKCKTLNLFPLGFATGVNFLQGWKGQSQGCRKM